MSFRCCDFLGFCVVAFLGVVAAVAERPSRGVFAWWLHLFQGIGTKVALTNLCCLQVGQHVLFSRLIYTDVCRRFLSWLVSWDEVSELLARKRPILVNSDLLLSLFESLLSCIAELRSQINHFSPFSTKFFHHFRKIRLLFHLVYVEIRDGWLRSLVTALPMMIDNVPTLTLIMVHQVWAWLTHQITSLFLRSSIVHTFFLFFLGEVIEADLLLYNFFRITYVTSQIFNLMVHACHFLPHL